METKFNFNSAVCTSKDQSERLLSLGLKKETADMVYRSFGYIIDEWGNRERRFETPKVVNDWMGKYDIPAWSLHRLWDLGKFMGINLSSEAAISNLYEYAIAQIEKQIKEGYFNKEYLCEK